MEKLYKVVKFITDKKLTYIEVNGFKDLKKYDIFTFDRKHYMIMVEEPNKNVDRSGYIIVSGKSEFIDLRELIEKPHTS